uniref:Uncharacterized protein n=1 Tax=Rhizophagus irregularis (strain DAOM 181602 / DAOM 197198 / MUCL 43194) TaxID=747089 RepID=U9U488_RHIID
MDDVSDPSFPELVIAIERELDKESYYTRINERSINAIKVDTSSSSPSGRWVKVVYGSAVGFRSSRRAINSYPPTTI